MCILYSVLWITVTYTQLLFYENQTIIHLDHWCEIGSERYTFYTYIGYLRKWLLLSLILSNS